MRSPEIAAAIAGDRAQAFDAGKIERLQISVTVHGSLAPQVDWGRARE